MNKYNKTELLEVELQKRLKNLQPNEFQQNFSKIYADALKAVENKIESKKMEDFVKKASRTIKQKKSKRTNQDKKFRKVLIDMNKPKDNRIEVINVYSKKNNER